MFHLIILILITGSYAGNSKNISLKQAESCFKDITGSNHIFKNMSDSHKGLVYASSGGKVVRCELESKNLDVIYKLNYGGQFLGHLHYGKATPVNSNGKKGRPGNYYHLMHKNNGPAIQKFDQPIKADRLSLKKTVHGCVEDNAYKEKLIEYVGSVARRAFENLKTYDYKPSMEMIKNCHCYFHDEVNAYLKSSSGSKPTNIKVSN